MDGHREAAAELLEQTRQRREKARCDLDVVLEQQQLRCRGRADGHRREARVHARVREEVAEEAGALVLRAQDGVVEWWSGVSATLT